MKIQPVTIDGITYNKEAVTDVRDRLIKLRDTSLELGDITDAWFLSHAVAILKDYLDRLES